MYLSKIELKNFRNYKSIKVKLSSHMNIFIGNNAQGKTNILESVYVLALTKSHRYGVENNLIHKDYDTCFIKGSIRDNNKLKDLEIKLDKQKKKFFINKKEIRKVSDYISNMKIIMFCPDDLDIIKGSPQIRRNLMNIQISQLFYSYVQYLNEYNKILKSRNEYLKLMAVNHYTDYRYLEILDQKLCDRAVKIYQYREKYLSFINEKIGEIFEKITSISGLNVVYENNIDLNDFSDDEIRKQFSKKLSSNMKREIMQGTTLYGPHRDDFSFYLGQNNMRLYGSQGQQRMAIVAFKLAEIELFKEMLGTSPILLLDDIFSELDISTRKKLIQFIPEDIQVIITTTDLKNIQKKIVSKAKVFDVEAGNITEKVE